MECLPAPRRRKAAVRTSALALREPLCQRARELMSAPMGAIECSSAELHCLVIGHSPRISKLGLDEHGD